MLIGVLAALATATLVRRRIVAVSFAIFAVVVVLAGRVTVLPLVPVLGRSMSPEATVLYILLPAVGVGLGAVAGARRDPFGGWFASLAGAALAGAVMRLVAPRYVGPARPDADAYHASLIGAIVMAQDFILFCTIPFAIAATIAWAIARRRPE